MHQLQASSTLLGDDSRLGPNGELPEYDNINDSPPLTLGQLAPGKQVTQTAANGVRAYFFKDNQPAAAKPKWPGSGELIGKVRIRNNDDLVVNPDTKEVSIRGQDRNMLDTFDHVVVLMLENRSFDNLLGYMYPDGVGADAPLGKSFDGVLGKDDDGNDKTLSNPVPPGDNRPNRLRVPVSPVEAGNYFQPYPDPGETYDHVKTQLFNGIPRVDKLASSPPGSQTLPTPMEGFVADYIENFKTDMKRLPTGEEYQQIMQCYSTQAVPVLTTLAEQFGVFDRWFCAVPSQTWCNRAFWNAGTLMGIRPQQRQRRRRPQALEYGKPCKHDLQPDSRIQRTVTELEGLRSKDVLLDQPAYVGQVLPDSSCALRSAPELLENRQRSLPVHGDVFLGLCGGHAAVLFISRTEVSDAERRQPNLGVL